MGILPRKPEHMGTQIYNFQIYSEVLWGRLTGLDIPEAEPEPEPEQEQELSQSENNVDKKERKRGNEKRRKNLVPRM